MPSVIDNIKTALSLPIEAVTGKQDFFSGDKRIYWIYLISSTLLALFVYVRSKRKEGFHKYIFHPKVWLSRSALIDYGYIFFNSLIKVFLLKYIIHYGKYISFYLKDYLISAFGYIDIQANLVSASLLYLICFTIIEDFFSFFIHWLHHKIPFLWNFHQTHHSATVLNPITQYRIHPVELFFNNISYFIAFGLVNGLFEWIFYNQASQVTAIETNIFAIIFLLWGANLRHSHVRLSYFSWLENIIISPYQHQIHHSDNPLHFNKNLGSKLAIWDLLFGTLIKSENAPKISFGLGKEDNKKFNSFLKTFLSPFTSFFKKK